MTINATIVKQVFNCNGSLYEFDFSFPINESDDLKLQVRDAAGIITDLEIVTQYEVSTDEIDFSNGGTITTVSYSSGSRQVYAFPNGSILTAYRETPLSQGSSYKNNRALNQDVLEDDFDKACMQTQELDEKLSRAIVVPIDEETGSFQLPTKSNRINKYMAFDSNGDPMASAGVAGVSVSSFMEPVVQADTALSARDLLGAKGNLDNVKTVIAAYTALTTDETLLCSSASGFTLTLFTAVGNAGKRLNIVNVGSGSIIVDGSGGETIGGSANVSLTTQYDTITIQSDGINWNIVSQNFIAVRTKIRPSVITDAEVATANKDGAAGTYSMRTLGTGAQQAMPGNATATPTDNSVTAAKLYANKSVGLSIPSTSTPLMVSSDTERSTNSTEYVKLKEIKIPKGGTLRIAMTLTTTQSDFYVYARIYRNNTPVGTERRAPSGGDFFEEISGWTENDLVQIWCKSGHYLVSCNISNFRIYATPYLITMD